MLPDDQYLAACLHTLYRMTMGHLLVCNTFELVITCIVYSSEKSGYRN